MSRPPTPVFVYGTLTDAERVDALLDDWRFDGHAVLEGCRRVEGEYPTLAPGGRVAGRLLVTPALDALDAYEGVASGLYVRESVPVRGGGERIAGSQVSSDERSESDGVSGVRSEPEARRGAKRNGGGKAWLYVGDPARLGAPASWPGDGPFAARVRSYLDASAVVRRPGRGAGRRPADR